MEYPKEYYMEPYGISYEISWNIPLTILQESY